MISYTNLTVTMLEQSIIVTLCFRSNPRRRNKNCFEKRFFVTYYSNKANGEKRSPTKYKSCQNPEINLVTLLIQGLYWSYAWLPGLQKNRYNMPSPKRTES
jgi:hypothetical protein